MTRLAMHDARLLHAEQRDAQWFDATGMRREIANAIKSTPADHVAQHRLITGAEGCGKTMLLACLADDLPNATHCAMSHGAAGLTGLWHAALRGLGVASAQSESPDTALARVIEHARKNGGRVTLLVDGFGRLLQSLGQEQEWALREALSHHPEIAMVAASRTLPESSYSYDGAFFDFFSIHTLAALPRERSADFLSHLAHALDEERLAEAIVGDPPRARAIATLTGGNPRALAFAIEAMLLHGPNATPLTCIDHLADRSSPAFERVLDGVSAQTRVVLTELARHWHPAHAKTIAARLAMPTNKVSTYLDRLCRDAIVDKVALPPGKTTGFQVRDRLLQLWFLLRDGESGRMRIETLAQLAAGDDAADFDTLRAGIDPEASIDWLAVELREFA